MIARARTAALILITTLVLMASATSFAESYRGLYLWASGHGLHGVWAVLWPLMVDTFIAVGELALFVALADHWATRSRASAWLVTVLGVVISIAGNVGHVTGHDLANRATAAVPPLAAAAALAVGLGVLKRVVAARPERGTAHAELGIGLARRSRVAPGAEPGPRDLVTVPADAQSAARTALAASVAAGNPVSQRQLMTRFGLTRTAEREVRSEVLAASNGHAPG